MAMLTPRVYFQSISAEHRISRSSPELYLLSIYLETLQIGIHQDKIQKYEELDTNEILDSLNAIP